MAREAAKQILLRSIDEETDPLRKHWAGVMVIEMESLAEVDEAINRRIDKIEERLDKIEARINSVEDAMETTDQEHALMIMELQIRLGLISVGSGGLITLITQVTLALFGK